MCRGVVHWWLDNRQPKIRNVNTPPKFEMPQIIFAFAPEFANWST